MKVLVIIPAYNEEESLPFVMEDLKSTCLQYDTLVVNDGSADGTAELCRKNGYNLLDLPINLGLAGAFQAGMRYAYENGYDAALQFDADGQHKACHIEQMVEQLGKGCDLVLGSRFVTIKRPRTLRMAGSILISIAIKITTGKYVSDPTSGMRLFNQKLIKTFAINMNYPPEPDTLSYLLRCGVTVCEVQIQSADRTAGTSYLTTFRSIKYMLHMAVSILLVQWFRKKNFMEGE